MPILTSGPKQARAGQGEREGSWMSRTGITAHAAAEATR